MKKLYELVGEEEVLWKRSDVIDYTDRISNVKKRTAIFAVIFSILTSLVIYFFFLLDFPLGLWESSLFLIFPSSFIFMYIFGKYNPFEYHQNRPFHRHFSQFDLKRYDTYQIITNESVIVRSAKTYRENQKYSLEYPEGFEDYRKLNYEDLHEIYVRPRILTHYRIEFRYVYDLSQKRNIKFGLKDSEMTDIYPILNRISSENEIAITFGNAEDVFGKFLFGYLAFIGVLSWFANS